MPITSVTYKLIHEIKNASVFSANPDVIEFGESNWYGDVSYQQLEQDIDLYIPDEETKNRLKNELASSIKEINNLDTVRTARWDIARIFYKTYLDYSSYTAVDLRGSPSALKLDLNQPISLERQHEISISFGTAEHVFNVYQFFKTLHEATKPGGIMIISMPFQGWVDNGFYNFQPTFYYDLAAANGYKLPLLLYSRFKSNALLQIANREHITTLTKQDAFTGSGTLFAALQKPLNEHPFSTPQQGYYNQQVSQTVINAWLDNR